MFDSRVAWLICLLYKFAVKRWIHLLTDNLRNDYFVRYKTLTLWHDIDQCRFENYYKFGLETNLLRVKDKAIIIMSTSTFVPFLWLLPVFWSFCYLSERQSVTFWENRNYVDIDSNKRAQLLGLAAKATSKTAWEGLPEFTRQSINLLRNGRMQFFWMPAIIFRGLSGTIFIAGMSPPCSWTCCLMMSWYNQIYPRAFNYIFSCIFV